ncbi:MAG: SMC family ATPase, partial [Chloroflexia bacterium]|nr:SMC family ATPase [Chloroflexia bacterium]
QIENYKQYGGNHDIEVPAQATIGVIGENGAGKTTLFEAIEWCLYSPRGISPSDVRPRGLTGHTAVRVYLESTDGARQFIVERVLKRAPSATIYQIHPSGDIEPVVQGTRQVSDYVAAKLIGLSHTAFTATFFTRQKELHLFGDQTPGRRREEVGRLLGLETIRTAQKSIIADRSKAAVEAKAILTQYERESAGRDLAAELVAAATAIEERTAQVATDAGAVASSENACATAEAAVAQAQDRRNQDTSLGQQLGQLTQERQTLDHRRSRVGAELARLDGRDAERLKLAPVAAQLESLWQRIREQEAERSRYERRNEFDRTLRECIQRQRELNGSVRDIVAQIVVSETIEGWIWSTDDHLNPVAGARRLIDIVRAADLDGSQSRERGLRHAYKAASDLETASATLVRYTAVRDGLKRDEGRLLGDGEPKDQIDAIDRERERLLHERTLLHARRTALEDDRDKARLILGNLDQQRFGDDCPTCGRPFSESDALVVAGAMRQRVDDMTRQIASVITEAKAADGGLSDLETARQQVFARVEGIESLRKRLQKSVSVLDAQQETVELATTALARSLEDTGLVATPTLDDIARAEGATRQMHALVSTRATLTTSIAGFEQLDARYRSAASGREKLGEIGFDPAAFLELQRGHQAADRAQAAIAQIDHDLARRPELESEIAAATLRIEELNDSIATLTAQRTALGFQPAELETAHSALQSARTRERAAVERYHRTITDLRETELRRDGIVRERERLDRLAQAADAKRSEADHLDLMAKEFTEFERFAASRKRPILAEYTSHLVHGITDGKYDRVDFDQDFGIIVYEGEDLESSYAVDTFSGGERDAITLAARIALSQMIGRQAANPPGFLVLDEVFGSLDTDRRAHLLDLLGSISGTFEELRQVFIISHVDDVRTSPVLDELWRIEETADGSSALTSLSPGVEIDSL